MRASERDTRDTGRDRQTSTRLELIDRQSFVGRTAELRQIEAAFDVTAGGHGVLVEVLGEPGIGKSAICDQLAGYAIARGGRVLTGYCYEGGSRSLPYLPFIQVLRQCVLSDDLDQLAAELGAGIADIARIIPEVRERLSVPEAGVGDPESDRWRLLQATADLLRSVSQRQPLMIVLEDLHDADAASLDLLIHLSRRLPDSRLLLVATYRDVDVDRAHSLSAALAELRRARSFVRLHLRGLDLREVEHMLSAMTQEEIPRPLAELVHRQTEGNPLFVQELLRYLIEERLLEKRDGRLERIDPHNLAVGIPEGLRDVIGRRLSGLSEVTNEVLAVAAVLGIEFQLQALLHVAQQPEDEVIAALEEAARAAVVDERPQSIGRVSYRFTHAFIRQTLYEELSAPRRMRWHHQVAQALEHLYQRHLDEHSAELAEHFLRSGSTDDLARGMGYAEIAAGRAMVVYAYGDAVGLLEQALEALQLLDPADWAKRCDLLLALGDALLS
jgi:predicted ATPase